MKPKKTNALASLKPLLAAVLIASAVADEPDKNLLEAGFKRLKALKHSPNGICAETEGSCVVEVGSDKIAKATNAIVHMDGMQLSNNPKWEVRDGDAFFNVGKSAKIKVGGFELQKGECVVLKAGRLEKLAMASPSAVNEKPQEKAASASEQAQTVKLQLEGWKQPVSVPAGFRLRTHHKKDGNDLWVVINDVDASSICALVIERVAGKPRGDLKEAQIRAATKATAVAAGGSGLEAVEINIEGSWELEKGPLVKNDDLRALGQDGVAYTKVGETKPSVFYILGGIVEANEFGCVTVGGAMAKKSRDSLVDILKVVDGLCSELKQQTAK